MSLWAIIALAIYGAVTLFLLATLIAQEALLDEPDWRSFWVPVIGSLLWGFVLVACIVMLLDDKLQESSLSNRA